ncbi:MAG: sensor histidine kinase [Solirubrobacteraceae bacterium]
MLAALVAAALLLARFHQTRQLRDLLLLAALSVAALTDFAFNAMPAYGYQTSVYGAGARMALAVLIAVSLAATALVPAHQVVAGRRRLGRVVALAALCWVAFGELIDLLVGPVRAEGSGGGVAMVPRVTAVIAFALLIFAAVSFAARREQEDRDAGLLGVAALLMAGVQLSRLALSVVPAEWVMPDDALRLGFYCVMLIVGVQLYRRSREEMEHDAVIAERLRIARDLHDGLAQDLAFIAAHSERLARAYGAEHPLTVAARRALAAARGEIVDLAGSGAESVTGALEVLAAEFEARFGVKVSVTGRDGDVECSESDRPELVRIAREAIANAVHHGGARHVEVTLGSRHGGQLLRVSDDGRGFGSAVGSGTGGTGLGLRTMRDRASRLGAAITIGGDEPGGTWIEVASLREGARSRRARSSG